MTSEKPKRAPRPKVDPAVAEAERKQAERQRIRDRAGDEPLPKSGSPRKR